MTISIFFRGKSLIRTKTTLSITPPPAKLDKSVIPLFRFSSADGIGALRGGGSGDNIDLDFKISGSEVSIKNFHHLLAPILTSMELLTVFLKVLSLV